jgi:hypothetical protein
MTQIGRSVSGWRAPIRPAWRCPRLRVTHDRSRALTKKARSEVVSETWPFVVSWPVRAIAPLTSVAYDSARQWHGRTCLDSRSGPIRSCRRGSTHSPLSDHLRARRRRRTQRSVPEVAVVPEGLLPSRQPNPPVSADRSRSVGQATRVGGASGPAIIKASICPV